MPTGSVGLSESITVAHQEWVHDFCNVHAAWDKTAAAGHTMKGGGIVIAHPDTGWTDHPELKSPNYITDPKISRGSIDLDLSEMLELTDNQPSSKAVFGASRLFASHGGATGSVIVSPRGLAGGIFTDDRAKTKAFPDNDPQAFVSGIAPDAKLIPYRVATRLGVLLTEGSDTAIVRTIGFCISLQRGLVPNVPAMDVAIMSVSLGRMEGPVERKMHNALEEAEKNNIVVVAAGGQLPSWCWFHDVLGSLISPFFPAADPSAVGVGGCKADKGWMPGGFKDQQTNNNIDIAAPGWKVWRATSDPPEFKVSRGEGTSHATAITAGACALWQAFHGRQKLKDDYNGKITKAFRHCLKESADNNDGDWDTNSQGPGILDVNALLEVPLPDPATL